MRREVVLMLLVFAAYLIRELWTLLPFSEEMLHPFLFSNQAVSLQSYLWIAGTYSFQMAIFYCLQSFSRTIFFQIAFWLTVLEFVEYFINYNEPWFHFAGINFNITNFRYFVLFILIIQNFLTYRKHE